MIDSNSFTRLRRDTSSDRARRSDGRKVFFVVEHVVEEVRQRVHGHQRDDLDDVRIGVADITDGLQIGVTDVAAGLDDFACKLDGGVPLRVAWHGPFGQG